MKERLTSVLCDDTAVDSAYLVLAQLSQGTATSVSVVLAIRRAQRRSPLLCTRVQITFAALFAKAAHLGIVFVTQEDERDAAAVAKAFYRRKL